MEIRAHDFQPSDLVGGHVALDLANTVTARNAKPGDWLDSYRRALEWAALTGQFEQRTLARLRRMDSANAAAGERALERLRELRETVYAAFVAVIRNERPPTATLEAFWKEAAAAATFTIDDGRLCVELDARSSGLDYLAHELALQAVDLLQDVPIARTRICPGCGWLFIDRSKGGQRRWCDMATCGNAEKSRRHYARLRAGRR
jgi:predicted RNA-binding Zn ribbon-like protein